MDFARLQFGNGCITNSNTNSITNSNTNTGGDAILKGVGNMIFGERYGF
ncbi:MAG: hypothetical protein QMC73_11935 [Myxococcota bacterium]|jgi:hypothetical protein